MTSITTARGVAANVYQIIERKSSIDGTTNLASDDMSHNNNKSSGLLGSDGKSLNLRGSVEFRDVTFIYPVRERDINMRAKDRESHSISLSLSLSTVASGSYSSEQTLVSR